MTKPSFVLRIRREKQAPADHEFDQGHLVVGRETGDIAMHDSGASARHAEIDFVDGKVVLRDAGSTNGTWIGSRRVTEERMTPGVQFKIGNGSIELLQVKGPVDANGSTRSMVAPGGHTRDTAIQTLPSAVRVSGRVAVASKQTVGLVAGVLVLAAAAFLFFRGGGEAKASRDGGTGAGAPAKLSLKAPREATVKAVWFRGPTGPQASGGTSPTTVRISPNTKEGPSVGVMEEFAGGAGNQWRTATWLAAFSASQVTGQSLTDYEFLVRTGGHIDGPSAGMLMTATMVALLRGQALREDTTMTGTINPDGSAGPVGGIVQKMEGAAKAGIKRFGFPMGARNHQDLRTGRTVDLFDAGKEFGLEVVEIHDVFEGYKFLTGNDLARPAPVAEGEMELDSDTSARLRAKNQAWKARLDSEVANLGSLARGGNDELKNTIMPLAQQADAAFKKAQEFERSDFLASSYDGYVEAAVLAGMTKDAARFMKSAQQQDIQDLVAQVEAAATVKGQLEAFMAEVEIKAKRTTGGGQINTLRAFHALVVGESLTSLGDSAFAQAKAILDATKDKQLDEKQGTQLGESLFNALRYFGVARTMLDVARDQQDFGNEEGQTAPIDSAVIGKAAKAYGSAAGAVLAYLESLTIDDIAREAGIDKATAQNRLAQNDLDYLLALRAVRLAEGIEGKKHETNLLRLAAGSMAFLKGASLINKYYSLGGQQDAQGTLTLTNRKALSAQLDLARQLAREAAAKAKRTVGFVPMAARYAYQLGVAQREGNDEDKLSALEAYWESAFWSDLAGARPTK
ncbi:MAG: FHA domain-containing protein [Planctomycetes bacterium]|nr:FHA domain-containing protein [Planctomycetota bacterium]